MSDVQAEHARVRRLLASSAVAEAVNAYVALRRRTLLTDLVKVPHGRVDEFNSAALTAKVSLDELDRLLNETNRGTK